ncbi:MAG: hypothetical protein QME94_13715 [Anaerolineae bacterium]|nr:hypothetical protein [Anaerolineae bacterium]
MIIDSHVHFSKYGHDGLSFAQVRDSLLAAMAAHGVARAIVMPDSEVGTVVSDLSTTLELVLGGNAARLFRLEDA